MIFPPIFVTSLTCILELSVSYRFTLFGNPCLRDNEGMILMEYNGIMWKSKAFLVYVVLFYDPAREWGQPSATWSRDTAGQDKMGSGSRHSQEKVRTSRCFLLFHQETPNIAYKFSNSIKTSMRTWVFIFKEEIKKKRKWSMWIQKWNSNWTSKRKHSVSNSKNTRVK